MVPIAVVIISVAIVAVIPIIIIVNAAAMVVFSDHATGSGQQ